MIRLVDSAGKRKKIAVSWLSLKSILDLFRSRTKENGPTGEPKKLKLVDIKRVIEEPGITGIKIHLKTWERLIQPFAPQRVVVSASPASKKSSSRASQLSWTTRSRKKRSSQFQSERLTGRNIEAVCFAKGEIRRPIFVTSQRCLQCHARNMDLPRSTSRLIRIPGSQCLTS